jgi:uncharacterized protein
MKLEQSFEVAAPVERVWKTLIDLEQVAPCLPGAAITGHDDDGTYHGTFQVKLGPTTASYRGTIRIQDADDATHTATLAAKGSDKRGQGGASATIVNTLHATDDGGTRVEAVTDFTITGRLASFGRGGMIKDISNRLLGEFAKCLQQRLAAEPEGAAMTAEDAAASAGAEARPEESAAAARGSGDEATVAAAGQATGAAPGTATGAGRTAGATTGTTPPPAPISGVSLVLGVIGDRLKALPGLLVAKCRELAPVVVGRVKAQVARMRERRRAS